ncbi:MAG: hypothetical protein K9N34_01285 [Candidatus Marinimicrobia bacterium]|nr:hypothetical protein [Candidatus Neomarinimicrobiota bacterium]MCF7839268.1 hypothetical protein [Candidatus Neomarinimicrobiota bacterium]MCF7902861.1 hypothetical protein [Candidatus Neomarinimicrobiota bacterium]
MYLRCIILILLTGQLLASGWLDLQQRSSPSDISRDMRALAGVMAVPTGDFLYEFGQVAYHQNFIPLTSGHVGQIQELGLAVQPLPEWIFTAQLWSVSAEYPVIGYGVGANYIWSFQGKNRWSTVIQNNEIRGQETFSQRDLSLTQQVTSVFTRGAFDLRATYNMEKTVYTDLPGLSKHERSHWIFSGNLTKNLFKSLRLDVCFLLNDMRPAGRVGVNLGIGN